MTCDACLAALSFHVEGTLAGPEASEVRAHLAACPSCRAAEAGTRAVADRIRALAAPEARRFRWMPAAAAAGILASLGLAWALKRPEGTSAPAAPRLPLPAVEFPASPGAHEAGERGLQLVLPGNGSLALVPGTRLTISRDGEVRLDSGALWARASVPLSVNSTRLLLGRALFRAGASPASWSLLPEALASDGNAMLEAVLLQDARLEAVGRIWEGPCRLRIRPEGAERSDLDATLLSEAFELLDRAEGAGPWQAAEAGPVASRRLLPVPPGTRDLVLEAVLRAPAGSQLALCHPAGGGTGYATLGGAALAPGAWQTLRMRLHGGRLEVLSDARTLLETQASAESRLEGAGASTGLLVWQGPVEVRSLRWRELGTR